MHLWLLIAHALTVNLNVHCCVVSLFAPIQMTGLNDCGKSTLMYKVVTNHSEIAITIPTIGFVLETAPLRRPYNFELMTYPCGGHNRRLARVIARHVAVGTAAIVFVVDSADRDTFEQAREEMEAMLNSDVYLHLPLLVLANKADLPTAASTAEVARALGVDRVFDRDFAVRACSAATGEGVASALSWVAECIAKGKGTAKHTVV